MPVVLKKIDENFSSTFNVGEHVLGRGPLLSCNSKKVSRNHGVLSVTGNEVFLKSTHNNPCFHHDFKTSNISLITFGNSEQIYTGDKIALSLDHGWFKVSIKSTLNSTNDEQDITQLVNNNVPNESTILEDQTHTSSKRNLEVEDEPDNAANKKQKITEHDSTPPENLNTTESVSAPPLEEHPPDVPLMSETEIKIEPIDEPQPTQVVEETVPVVAIKEEPVDETPTAETSSRNTPVVNANEIKTEPQIKDEPEDDISLCKKKLKDENADDDGKGKDEPSTSGTATRVWRDKCWYGKSCYRKNAAHRAELRHPGDSDYDSDPNDSRPICCYGAGCYRKNKDHRKRYRHPGQDQLGKPPTRPRRKTKKVASPVTDLEDSYDYSDPFINDGSSDEFEPSGCSDTESEYEDIDNDSQEDTARLLREAKKFTRNKK